MNRITYSSNIHIQKYIFSFLHTYYLVSDISNRTISAGAVDVFHLLQVQK